jgi:hypothetical protein
VFGGAFDVATMTAQGGWPGVVEKWDMAGWSMGGLTTTEVNLEEEAAEENEEEGGGEGDAWERILMEERKDQVKRECDLSATGGGAEEEEAEEEEEEERSQILSAIETGKNR